MVIISSQVETMLAKQYLFKLCKHFALKIRVDFTAEQGAAEYGIAYFQFGEQNLGQVELSADAKQIEFIIHATDATALTRLQSVIEDHLQLMRRAAEPALHWRSLPT